MNSVYDIFVLLNLILKQQKEEEYISVEEYNILLEDVNLEIFNEYSKDYEKDVRNSSIMSLLKVPLVDAVLTLGIWTKPVNYSRISSLRSPTDDLIELLTDSQLTYRLNNTVLGPTADNPIAVEYADTVKFYPTGLATATITYIKYPTTPIFVEKIEAGGAVYDSTASTQFDWSIKLYPEIAMKMLSYLGISLDKPQVIDYINKIEKDELTRN